MLDHSERRALLGIAREAIDAVLHDRDMRLAEVGISDALKQRRASFVTLKLDDELRGCIGTLEPVRRLVDDVAHNARAAAFRDPRFLPLNLHEAATLRIEISVLEVPRLLAVTDPAGLLERLRQDQPGLIVASGLRHATFLPSVWESLPDAGEFVAHLWKKAGLAPDEWPSDLALWTYGAEHFEEQVPDTTGSQG